MNPCHSPPIPASTCHSARHFRSGPAAPRLLIGSRFNRHDQNIIGEVRFAMTDEGNDIWIGTTLVATETA